MTTVVNNPGNGEGSGAGMIIGVIVAIVIIILFFVYGLPALREGNSDTLDVNVNLPTGDTGGTGGAAQ